MQGSPYVQLALGPAWEVSKPGLPSSVSMVGRSLEGTGYLRQAGCAGLRAEGSLERTAAGAPEAGMISTLTGGRVRLSGWAKALLVPSGIPAPAGGNAALYCCYLGAWWCRGHCHWECGRHRDCLRLGGD